MPLLKVTARKNAISPAQRRALAPLLTDIILAREVDHATDAGRRAAHILFAEFDGTSAWFTGGVPADDVATGPGLILFEITYPHGAADRVEKAKLHTAINTAAAKVLLGDDAPANALANWIIVHEVPEGFWGVRGNTVSVTDILGDVADPERIAYARALLAADATAAATHGRPAAIQRA